MRFSTMLLVLVVVLVGSVAQVADAATTWTIRVVQDPASGQPRFQPPLLFIEPGDTVRVEVAGTVYASRLIGGMHPPEAPSWWGQVGETVEVTLATPGVYGHKCGAGYQLGLVGLVVVGDPSGNLARARTIQHPPAAARVVQGLFAEIDARLRR